MTSMGVSLEFDTETIGPIHEGICVSPDLEREVILGGQAVDGVETITSFVYSDPVVYESLLLELESVREYDIVVGDRPVTTRQLTALEAAWEVGYYDVPRRNGIEAVAEELECAVSTASELLRRGEARVLGQYLDGTP